MSVPKLIHKNRVPYGGLYELNQKEIGMVGRGTTFDQLEASVLAYRHANGIPIGLGFIDELEAAVCSEYAVECKETDPNVPSMVHRLRLGDVITGTRVMMSFYAKGKPIVSAQEASRRAEICAITCKNKFNVHFAKPCGGWCGELRDVVKTLVGNQTTPYEDKLESCSICGCYLTASVWMDLKTQVAPLTQAQKNQFESVEHCWKKESLVEG